MEIAIYHTGDHNQVLVELYMSLKQPQLQLKLYETSLKSHLITFLGNGFFFDTNCSHSRFINLIISGQHTVIMFVREYTKRFPSLSRQGIRSL